MTAVLIKYLPIIHLGLGLLFSCFILGFLLRIVLSWYPQINIQKGFWLLISIPTEPFLGLTRRFITPIGGVDVTPVIWVGLTSLGRELLVGQQGLLSQLLTHSHELG